MRRYTSPLVSGPDLCIFIFLCCVTPSIKSLDPIEQLHIMMYNQSIIIIYKENNGYQKKFIIYYLKLYHYFVKKIQSAINERLTFNVDGVFFYLLRWLITRRIMS